ncbi:MAG: hypothetical protein ACLPX1_11400 [Steroidobacteraceae bacterium]
MALEPVGDDSEVQDGSSSHFATVSRHRNATDGGVMEGGLALQPHGDHPGAAGQSGGPAQGNAERQADGKEPAALRSWNPVTPGDSASAIPVVKGLKVVTAITGDYESIKSIEDVAAVTVRLRVSGDKPAPKLSGLVGGRAAGQADPKNESPAKTKCLRVVNVTDRAKGTSSRQVLHVA